MYVEGALSMHVKVRESLIPSSDGLYKKKSAKAYLDQRQPITSRKDQSIEAKAYDFSHVSFLGQMAIAAKFL